MAETVRENIRESTLEGLDTAARRGKHGGRPPVITADMLHTVLRRRAGGESVEQIQPDLIIPTGKRKGQNPSVASIYRALAEHAKREAYPEAVEAAHADFAALKARDVPAPRTADQLEPTRYLAVLQCEEGGPAVTGEWTDDAPALRTYRGWVGLYGSQDSVVIRQGVTVRRGQGYSLRITVVPGVHRQLLARCQPLDGGQGVPTVPAQRKARREYENRVTGLGVPD
ncbi:hypothetical protein [Streptomyces sp. Tu 3180]|uniref:hypothetical protein n=1 Tax=Streptomyces sp. Tu 3180 TaxID=2682611 RepID=UPI001FB77468|nr:hypothetical protein [Streptomyces sp. Tu 3180]